MKDYILVFDTETIDVEHAFCYNVGYVIANVHTREIAVKRDYVVKQVWENTMLFSTAYYADKKEKYVSALRGRNANIKHWGHICQRLIKDIEEFEIEYIYAFNSPFDIRVFEFNCEWFKNVNPMDYAKSIDIRSLINPLLFSKEYQEFCETNLLFTENGNYSGNAESVTKFIRQDTEFIEDHTALSDALIELEILWYMQDKFGADIFNENGKVYASVKRLGGRSLVVQLDKQEILNVEYVSRVERNGILYLTSKEKYLNDKATKQRREERRRAKMAITEKQIEIEQRMEESESE